VEFQLYKTNTQTDEVTEPSRRGGGGGGASAYRLEQLSLESVDLERQSVDGVLQLGRQTMVLLRLSAQLLQQPGQLAVLGDHVTTAPLFSLQLSLHVVQLSS